MTRTSRRVVRLAFTIALLVIAGSGCTSSSRTGDTESGGALTNDAKTNGLERKSATQVQRELGAALKTAKSVHVTVTGPAPGGQPQLDLRIQGSSSTGAMGLGGVKFQITAVGGNTYIKGDQRVWEAFGVPAAVQQRLAGRWVKVRPQQMASLQVFSLDSLATVLTRNGSPLAPKVEQATLDGRKVLVLSQRDGSKVYVANTGPAYPLRSEGKGQDAARIDFSEYGTDFHITAPSNAVDLAAVG
jgi:hypothetical protein